MPEEYRQGLQAVRGTMAVALQLPERLTVSEWADRERVLDARSSAEAGPWRTDRTPYLREVMDAFVDPEVERITMCFCTQVGKTEVLLNCLGYAVDQDPGPALYVLPTETTVTSFSQQRLAPALLASPAVARHMGVASADAKKFTYSFDRMTLFLAWSNSPAALASNPIRYLFMDEVDKYPAWSGNEASPVDLARERLRTFWNSKCVECSTPTTKRGYIWQAFQQSDRCRYKLPCPTCGAYHHLEWVQIRWPETERDPRKIKAERMAWYECPSCQARIEEDEKWNLLERGVWCPEGCEVDTDGTIQGVLPSRLHRGFHMSALYSPWVSWSELAGDFLVAKDRPERLQNFVNSVLAQLWEETDIEIDEAGLKRLEVHEHREGTVPDEAVLLLATADVQKDHIHYVVRAWGYDEESWLVERGLLRNVVPQTGEVVDSEFEALHQWLDRASWARRDGKRFQVRHLGVDCGYRTDEVYAFCRRNRGRARAMRGSPVAMIVPWLADDVDRDPRTGKTWKDGQKSDLHVWRVATAYWKDKLAREMSAAEPRWHLHVNTSDTHYRELASEHKVMAKNRQSYLWVKRPGGGENHGLDLEVYQLALADMLQVPMLRRPAPAASEPREPEASRARIGWFARRT